MKQQIFLAALLILSAAACDKSETPKVDIKPVPVESVSELAKMNQIVAWKLFAQEQAEQAGENILISPLSIQTALNMALNGANGSTLEELQQLLGCPDCDLEDLNRLQRDFLVLLSQQSGHPSLTVANGFFYDPNRINVKADFLSTMDSQYDSELEELNFDAEQAALQIINDWVKEGTKGKIPTILDQITPLDVAFLINALHFKADWASGFSEETTFTGTFTKGDGSQAEVPFVSGDRLLSFSQADGFNLVDLPFRDSTFSLSLVQPNGDVPNNWMAAFNPDSWQALYRNMTYERALLSFPKLKLSYENDLIKGMQALGVNAPFDPNLADFERMGTAANNLFINQLKHKAVLEVDEKGAEGAAVTVVGIGTTSLPPSFRFDSPFVLALRHIPTGALVFVGLVVDPV